MVCTVDNESLGLHDSHTKKLLGMMTIHVDDLKLAGEHSWMKAIMVFLQRTYGELNLTWNEFANCGVTHIQKRVAKDVTLDQIQVCRFVTKDSSSTTYRRK